MQLFESIKHQNEHGQEYRKARELAKVMSYNDFGNFENVIAKAKIACKQAWQHISDHIAEATEMVSLGLGTSKLFPSYHLSRYACYLIAMEADSRKEIVAQAKSYFTIQTRKQEINEQYLEDSKRVAIREQLSEHNKELAKTAKKAEVWNYGEFTDYGYLGLYWMRNKDIIKYKGLSESDKLLDTISSEELAANLFRATQAEAKIKREGIIWQDKASKAHLEIGKEVRTMIKKIWWTMPEDLPAVDNINEAKKRVKNTNKLIKR